MWHNEKIFVFQCQNWVIFQENLLQQQQFFYQVYQNVLKLALVETFLELGYIFAKYVLMYLNMVSCILISVLWKMEKNNNKLWNILFSIILAMLEYTTK